MPEEVTFRVNTSRDTSLSIREDMLADLLDMLKDISTTNSYNTNPVKNLLFRIEELNDKELPCNIIYDHESTQEGNTASWKHKLTVTIAHITMDGKDTSASLTQGLVDILTVIGKFHGAFCSKYHTAPLKLISTQKGLESNDKTRGEMDAVIEISYGTPVWTI